MKILWLEHPSRLNRYDDWLHFRFAKELSKYEDIFFYGPQLKDNCPEFTPIAYKESITLDKLVSDLKIDLVILDTKASAFKDYFPATLYPKRDMGQSILPKDFAKCEVPKLCIEEDFHYETDDKWHRDMGFKALLQKHYCQFLRGRESGFELEFISFPFSVDTNVFCGDNRERKERLCVAGTVIDNIYPARYKASVKLSEANMIDIFQQQEKNGDKYVECLKDYVGHVSCGSRYGLSSAKTFEIMASGSVLFTDAFIGINDLLDEGSYVEYAGDASDIVSKAKRVLEDKEYREGIINKALLCIHTRHSHHIRIKQLLEIIKRFA